jgi:hypothetical protein
MDDSTYQQVFAFLEDLAVQMAQLPTLAEKRAHLRDVYCDLNALLLLDGIDLFGGNENA